jgi:hypothetical protein
MVSHPKFVTLIPGTGVVHHSAVAVSLGANVDGGVLGQILDTLIKTAANVLEATQAECPLLQTIDIRSVFKSHIYWTMNVLAKVGVAAEDLFV